MTNFSPCKLIYFLPARSYYQCRYYPTPPFFLSTLAYVNMLHFQIYETAPFNSMLALFYMSKSCLKKASDCTFLILPCSVDYEQVFTYYQAIKQPNIQIWYNRHLNNTWQNRLKNIICLVLVSLLWTMNLTQSYTFLAGLEPV